MGVKPPTRFCIQMLKERLSSRDLAMHESIRYFICIVGERWNRVLLRKVEAVLAKFGFQTAAFQSNMHCIDG